MTHSELYQHTAHAVEDYLERHLLHAANQAADIHLAYGELWQHMRQVAKGGKKLRPYLTMIGYGEFSDKIMPVAAAQELLHVAVLIHDDIVDEDTVRHGMDNMNGLYQAKYQPYLPADRSTHYSYTAGLLAGDALLSEAYQLIAAAGLEPQVTASLTAQLHKSIFEVIGGELMDIEASFIHDTAYDPLLIYRYKTAGYSFVGPLLSGALCKGATAQTRTLLEQAGLQLGVAFQLQDDLLGVFGNEAKPGKSVLLDLKEGKATYLVAHHKERMNAEQRERFASTFGNLQADDVALYQLRDDLAASGAKQQCEALIQQYFTEARATISGLTSELQRRELGEMIDMLDHRQK